jgi:hypothetical protein
MPVFKFYKIAIMKLQIDEIKKQFPDEWVLLKIDKLRSTSPQNGEVLLHGKDYLELCYKSSEVAKDVLTTIIFTGTPTKNRKWLKSIRLSENQTKTSL